MAIRELSGAPSMLPLFVRAGAAIVPGASRLPFVGGRGREVPDLTLVLNDVTVDRDRLAAYDRVCGFPPRDCVPPTYPHILAFPLQLALMTDGGFPFPAIGLVHIVNRIIQHRPVDLGETLSLRVSATPLAPHPRGTQFSLLTEARVGDELVWEEVSTNLRRGRGSGEGSAEGSAEGSRQGSGEGSRQGSAEGSRQGSGEGSRQGSGEGSAEGSAEGSRQGSGEGLAEGSAEGSRQRSGEGSARGSGGPGAFGVPGTDELPVTATWRLPGDLGRRYGSVSGDLNPIHVHSLSARLFGFPSAIAHGMWTKARSLAALEPRLPDAFTVDVAFKRPILLPATVSFAQAQAQAPVDHGVRFGVRDAATGKPHLDGAVSFL